mmetsp:Transcript_19500/g.60565  ORF Transcript_19500/g.60565 Transcript_19500/m.60565 type:complete len:331 (+) Transcript_19500:514-1506(+)
MCRLRPKSAIFSTPHESTKMFAGLMSRCKMLWWCRNANPSRICRMQLRTNGSGCGCRGRRTSARLPLGQYSRNRRALCPRTAAPRTRTTCGCGLRLHRRPNSRVSCPASPTGTCFSAAYTPVSTLRTSVTVPKEPRPSARIVTHLPWLTLAVVVSSNGWTVGVVFGSRYDAAESRRFGDVSARSAPGVDGGDKDTALRGLCVRWRGFRRGESRRDLCCCSCCRCCCCSFRLLIARADSSHSHPQRTATKPPKTMTRCHANCRWTWDDAGSATAPLADAGDVALLLRSPTPRGSGVTPAPREAPSSCSHAASAAPRLVVAPMAKRTTTARQ